MDFEIAADNPGPYTRYGVEGFFIHDLAKKKIALFFLVGWLFLFNNNCWGASETGAHISVPVDGMVTMVDLGANACIPCKMMAPILKKLKKTYDGKAAIVFIDVWKNRSHAKKFNIRAIPTQIFFDKKGAEIFRHVGFMDEKAIVQQLRKMGVDQEIKQK